MTTSFGRRRRKRRSPKVRSPSNKTKRSGAARTRPRRSSTKSGKAGNPLLGAAQRRVPNPLPEALAKRRKRKRSGGGGGRAAGKEKKKRRKARNLNLRGGRRDRRAGGQNTATMKRKGKKR